MTSAEKKAAEASAPPVQTGYFDPNNPGRQTWIVMVLHFRLLRVITKIYVDCIVLYARLYFQVWFYKNLFTGQAYVPPPAYYNDPPPGYTDTMDKKND